MSIEQEEILGNINAMRWSKGGDFEGRDLPVWNDIDVSSAEYTEFWNWINDKSDSLFRWMNQYVLQAGIQLPYWNLEYLTRLTFYPHAMISVIDLYYNESEK